MRNRTGSSFTYPRPGGLSGLPLVRIEGEHAVHLQSVGVAGAAGCRGKHAVDECTEDAFIFRVGLLVPVVGPDLLGEREFGRGQFADGGGGHGKQSPCGEVGKEGRKRMG